MSSYCARANVEARFGVDNVALWATLADGDSAATILARINTGIAVASDELDEILRCISGYEGKLPMSTVPDSVCDKVAIRAGLWLYSFMATDDSPQTTGYVARLEERLDKWTNEIREGFRKLDLR